MSQLRRFSIIFYTTADAYISLPGMVKPLSSPRNAKIFP
jgi:hypothetical protein